VDRLKRTAEIVLSVIGVAIYLLFAGAIGALKAMLNNAEVMNQVKKELTGEELAALDLLVESMNESGGFVIGTFLVGAVLGIVAIFLLKGNKKPVAAGIILFATAVLTTVVTAGSTLIPGLFYVIAGILALVRKAPQTVEQQL